MTHEFRIRKNAPWSFGVVMGLMAVMPMIIGASESAPHDHDHPGHNHDEQVATKDHDTDADHGKTASASGGEHGGTSHADVTHDNGREHASHDHDDHDRHQGHDGHEEAGHGFIHVEPQTLEEFGVVIQEAGPGTLDQLLTLHGEVVFNADQIAHVTPAVAGTTLEVTRSVGDKVRQGDVMAVLNSRELASARSVYLARQAQLDLAQETLARDEELFKSKIGTQRSVLESQQAVREARIALRLAQQHLHALGQAHAGGQTVDDANDTPLGRYELRAPISGIVIARELTRGEVVREQPEESPFIVADLSSIWVNLTVYQRDLGRVRSGLRVRVEFGHGIPDAGGTIAWVSPALDEKTRTATARLVLDNPHGHWRPGLFVTGYVTVNELTVPIVAPRTALQVVEGTAVVFVQTQGGFEPRPVQTGRSNPTHVEIVAGLSHGDRYVAQNALMLKAELQKGAFGDGHAH